MSLKIDDNNYESYKKVVAIFWRHLSLNPDSIASSIKSPLEVLTRMEATLPKSKLRSGLRQCLGDLLVWIKDFPKVITDVNIELIKNGLPNVKTLQGLIHDTTKKVITRQKIRNLDEYYIIKELIDDTISDITDHERLLLCELMTEFESMQRPANSA